MFEEEGKLALLINRCNTQGVHPSALEIVTKLCDSDFARKAKAADFLSRAWDGLRAAGAGDGDKVSRIRL